MLSSRRNRKRRRANWNKQRRIDSKQRIHTAEQLEIRAAPGSAVVDVLMLIGHPLTKNPSSVQPIAAQQSVDSLLGMARPTSVQPEFETDCAGPAVRTDGLGTWQSAVHSNDQSAHRTRVSYQDRDNIADNHDSKARDGEGNRIDPSDLWFTQSTELASSGLDDGLEPLLGGHQDAKHPSGTHSSSGSSPSSSGGSSQSYDPNTSPNSPSGSGIGQQSVADGEPPRNAASRTDANYPIDFSGGSFDAEPASSTNNTDIASPPEKNGE